MSTAKTGRPFLDELGDQPGVVLAFAHRGGVYHPEIEGLENTLTAFRHAVALGYRYLETDVHVSADGVLLAFHDEVLDRVTDSRGPIASLSYATIRAARVGGREEVPTLASLVEEFPDARFNVDLKVDHAVPVLAELIEARGLHDRVLVGSFSPRRLRAFRRRTHGRVATSASPPEVAAWAGLLPAVVPAHLAGDFDALQVPHRGGPFTIASARLVRRAHAHGKHVHVWTVDDVDEMDLLLDRGVDGLFTDRTDVLRDVLVRRGQWAGPVPGTP